MVKNNSIASNPTNTDTKLTSQKYNISTKSKNNTQNKFLIVCEIENRAFRKNKNAEFH